MVAKKALIHAKVIAVARWWPKSMASLHWSASPHLDLAVPGQIVPVSIRALPTTWISLIILPTEFKTTNVSNLTFVVIDTETPTKQFYFRQVLFVFSLFIRFECF